MPPFVSRHRASTYYVGTSASSTTASDLVVESNGLIGETTLQQLGESSTVTVTSTTPARARRRVIYKD